MSSRRSAATRDLFFRFLIFIRNDRSIEIQKVWSNAYYNKKLHPTLGAVTI